MEAIPSPALFDSILDFLASTPTPEQIVAYQPSEALNQRLHELLDKNQRETITEAERAELDEFLRMNHFLKMLKIKARHKLAAS